jgi:guanine deaminase
VHLEPGDHAALAAAGASIAYCPSSNLFLGSGLFDLATAREHGIRIGLGTDVGAGPSFSLLRTFADAYKGLQLRGQALHSLTGLYLATLGAARALHLDDRIGNFAPGKEADFIVVDSGATPLLARRAGHAEGLADELFALLMLGDDRAIAATYLLGERVCGAEDADVD